MLFELQALSLSYKMQAYVCVMELMVKLIDLERNMPLRLWICSYGLFFKHWVPIGYEKIEVNRYGFLRFAKIVGGKYPVTPTPLWLLSVFYIASLCKAGNRERQCKFLIDMSLPVSKWCWRSLHNEISGTTRQMSMQKVKHYTQRNIAFHQIDISTCIVQIVGNYLQ